MLSVLHFCSEVRLNTLAWKWLSGGTEFAHIYFHQSTWTCSAYRRVNVFSHNSINVFTLIFVLLIVLGRPPLLRLCELCAVLLYFNKWLSLLQQIFQQYLHYSASHSRWQLMSEFPATKISTLQGWHVVLPVLNSLLGCTGISI